MNFYREFWRYSHLFTICVFVIVIVLIFRGKAHAHTFDCHVHTPNAQDYYETEAKKEQNQWQETKYNYDKKQEEKRRQDQWESDHADPQGDYYRENHAYYQAEIDIGDYGNH
jgi:hypothetical protein